MSLTYFSILVISYFGLFVGMLFRKVAKEEAKQYSRFLKNLDLGLLLILTVSLLYYKFFITGVVGLILIGLLYWLKKLSANVVYPLLGIVFFITSSHPVFLIASFLIFLYGFFAVGKLRWTILYLIVGAGLYLTQFI